MLLRKILWVFLCVIWGVVFSSICAAAPLMVEKNLFAPDRKPPAPESETSAGPAKPGMAIGNIQLDGVMILGNSKKAILRLKSPPAGPPGKKGQPASPFVSVREGQMVSEYRVSKIESKAISLEKDGQTFIVALFATNKVVTPASPVPPPAAPPAQTPPVAPGVAQQEAGTNPPPGAQVQASDNNPQVPPPPVPGAGLAGRGGGPHFNRNVQQNVNVPPQAQEINQDQPAETIDEE